MKTEQEKYMNEAYKEAKKAYEKLEVPVGAVIVKDGKIIDSIAGETSGASLVELFKKYGIINE
jgi:tRNA(Arg) A34 adenosine deaminase TadA